MTAYITLAGYANGVTGYKKKVDIEVFIFYFSQSTILL